MGLPERPLFLGDAEPFAPEELAGAGDCDPSVKPGVSAFRGFLMGCEGGRDLGILRPCQVGGPSEHHEGRAWDWGMAAANAAERGTVDRVFAWLLANDAERFRRFGLMYAIWDRRIWSVRTRDWRAYGGVDPHTTHVHFSFGWSGAKAQASAFRWLAAGAPSSSTVGVGAMLLFVGAACVAGYYALRG